MKSGMKQQRNVLFIQKEFPLSLAPACVTIRTPAIVNANADGDCSSRSTAFIGVSAFYSGRRHALAAHDVSISLFTLIAFAK